MKLLDTFGNVVGSAGSPFSRTSSMLQNYEIK
jgi:hypothetical protein